MQEDSCKNRPIFQWLPARGRVVPVACAMVVPLSPDPPSPGEFPCAALALQGGAEGKRCAERSQMRRTGKIGCTGMFQFPIVKMGCNWSPSSSYSSSALQVLPTHSPSMPITPSLLIWRDRKEGGLII